MQTCPVRKTTHRVIKKLQALRIPIQKSPKGTTSVTRTTRNKRQAETRRHTQQSEINIQSREKTTIRWYERSGERES